VSASLLIIPQSPTAQSRFRATLDNTMFRLLSTTATRAVKQGRHSQQVKAFSNFHANASHIDTPDNTEDTYFDFTPENYKRVRMAIRS
jgi:hypothetical protein